MQGVGKGLEEVEEWPSPCWSSDEHLTSVSGWALGRSRRLPLRVCRGSFLDICRHSSVSTHPWLSNTMRLPVTHKLRLVLAASDAVIIIIAAVVVVAAVALEVDYVGARLFGV